MAISVMQPGEADSKFARDAWLRALAKTESIGQQRITLPEVIVRLAGEFHTRLGEMAGNTLLRRYLGEVVSRCSLILALYGRPHSADCAVNEHREIVAALRARDAAAAIAVMDHHLGAVEKRALLDQVRVGEFDLGEVLSRYVEDNASSPKVAPLPKRRKRAAE